MAGLRGKVVLITGAVSGIGRATAAAFSRAGARLALVGRSRHPEDSPRSDEGRLEALVEECLALGAEQVRHFQLDLASRRDGFRTVIERSVEAFKGDLNVLVNNSAVVFPEDSGSAAVEDDEAFLDLLGANVLAAVRFSQLSVPHLLRSSKNGAAIVNVNGPSISLVLGPPWPTGSGKETFAAMDELTRQLASDLAAKGIRVNAVTASGLLSLRHVDSSERNRSMPSSSTAASVLRHLDPSLVDPDETYPCGSPGGQGAKKGLLLNKVGSTDDVSKAIRFLASDEASFITGRVLAVDGGASLRAVF